MLFECVLHRGWADAWRAVQGAALEEACTQVQTQLATLVDVLWMLHKHHGDRPHYKDTYTPDQFNNHHIDIRVAFLGDSVSTQLFATSQCSLMRTNGVTTVGHQYGLASMRMPQEGLRADKKDMFRHGNEMWVELT